MNVKELRLGNLVYVENELYHTDLKEVVMSINAICKTSITVTCFNDEIGCNIEFGQRPDFIKPIPITEECLLKNGAIRLKNNSFTSFNLFGIQLNFIDDIWIEYVSQKKITGIHHLQNIFYFNKGRELPLV